MLSGLFDLKSAGIGSSDAQQLPERLLGSAGERRPVFCRPGFWMAAQNSCASGSGDGVTWDGRLDNGAELAQRYAPFSSTDAGMVLPALQQRGEAAFNELTGDWSAAWWDEKRQAVILASDYIGVRPLYYHHTPGRLMWSSSIADLVAAAPEARDIDEEYVAEFLQRGGSWSRTPYRGIRIVPPGHALRVSSNAVELISFWLPKFDEIRFRDERDYVARFRQLFEDAVAARLRNPGTVYAELSGGLDSSAVVCTANRLIRDGRVAAGPLKTVHYYDEGSGDRQFHELLQRMLGLESISIDARKYPFLMENSAGRTAPMWWQSRYSYMARHLQSLDAPVLLTGRLGDLVMGNYFDDSEQVADLLQANSPAAAFRQALAWSRLLHVPVYSVMARALRSRLLKKAQPTHQREDSLSATFRERTNTGLPTHFTGSDSSALPPSRRQHVGFLMDAIASRVLQTPEPLQPFFYTHPYTHRPLLEYMLAIPSSVLCGPNEPRKLMRSALQGALPRPLLARRSKASFSAVFRAALQPLATTLLQEIQNVRMLSRGWLDRQSLVSRLDRFLHGLECNESQLRHIILMEFWIRSLEEN